MSKITIKGFNSGKGASFREFVSLPLETLLDYDDEKATSTTPVSYTHLTLPTILLV